MKILVLGAPGVGKTKFAKSLGRKRKLKVFDGLPEKFIKKTDLALGEISDYRVDFIFVGDILSTEYKNQDIDYVITAGPLYAYCHFLYKTSLTEDDAKVYEYLWIMMTMSRIALDSLWYDEIYYIPYKGEEDTFEYLLDKMIKNAIKEFSLEEKVTTVE
jgi:cytidylate kinase